MLLAVNKIAINGRRILVKIFNFRGIACRFKFSDQLIKLGFAP